MVQNNPMANLRLIVQETQHFPKRYLWDTTQAYAKNTMILIGGW